jgi:cytochrome c oxidase assembly protein subunit 15
VHQSFTLSDFKFIFFWEWFHRLWARLLGVVFLIGFIYFLATKKFNKKMVPPMAILFLLGGLQGVIGWLMVKSGLVPEKYFVGHIELATHFIAALGLLAYTLWFALSLLVKPQQIVINAPLQKMMLGILMVLIVQLFYGAFMAGLHAAVSAPTWPDINGKIIPGGMDELSPWAKNLTNNNITVHFIHRGMAYLLFALVVMWWVKAKVIAGNRLFSRLRSSVMIIVLLQVCVGILTVLNATNSHLFVPFGVLHQAMAMLLLMCVVTILYVVKKKNNLLTAS